MLLHNSRADESGGSFATCWFMVILPVIPLSRYYVRQTGYSDESGFFSTKTTTRYEIVGRSRIRWIEVLRLYLAWWIVVPTAVVGPIVVDLRSEDENDGLYGMFVSVGLFFLLLILFGLYAKYWRPVREFRWAEAATGATDGRSWQRLASMLESAVLMGGLGFFVGVVIFFTALAMDALPSPFDPEPNPYANTLLHPVTLLVGLPVLTGMVTLAVLASRRRR